MESTNIVLKIDKDTIKVIDTTAIIKNANTVILLHDKAKELDSKEPDLITSIMIPILTAAIIAFIGGYISYRFNKKKTDAEIKKIKGDSNKTVIEIQKLITENEKLKKSFQPIVIATLQATQEKVISLKIEAIKKLIDLKSEFIYYEQQLCEGDPVSPNLEEFLKLVFFNFDANKFKNYTLFHNTYSYLFPDFIFNDLKKLNYQLRQLNENKKSFMSYYDGDDEPLKTDKDSIVLITKLYDSIILAIRKDCHLDTSFIHDFIDQNK